MLRLVESFISIQGEGKYSGKYALFVRFAGCNLRCRGFGVNLKSPKTSEILVGCDTIKAVETSHFSYQNISNLQELLSLSVAKIPINLKPIVVITGGEPLIHHKNDIFCEFINYLLNHKFEVHFETNGSVFVDFDKFSFLKNCIFCVSIKLSNSGEIMQNRINLDALRAIKKNAKDSFYKFVLNAKDISNLSKEIKEILDIVPNEVYCMPMGATQTEIISNAAKVCDFCIKNGYNYTDRLHIRLWNDKEGV
ncbi:7-carboxy-7-deazaguanine synthase QueE [Campylobacter sputorum]|uniref:7-carboxy-7-deazaguanine synthase QueE n=1 Tax=Campylobacter sputorum TaxID=206 RepID=UPI00053BFD5C|nr:7-carboxy-7-deazaguanine synthase QueE [Campylobacter sputorum]